MSDLEKKKCVPCDAGTPPLSEKEEYDYLAHVQGWSLDKKRVHQIKKLLHFPSFSAAIDFVNQVAAIAEKENHHPDIYISYQHVTVVLWTKKITGLSENDFILAAKIDQLPLPQAKQKK